MYYGGIHDSTINLDPIVKTAKESMIRFRCEAKQKEQLDAMAAAQDLDAADLLRRALKLFLAQGKPAEPKVVGLEEMMPKMVREVLSQINPALLRMDHAIQRIEEGQRHPAAASQTRRDQAQRPAVAAGDTPARVEPKGEDRRRQPGPVRNLAREAADEICEDALVCVETESAERKRKRATKASKTPSAPRPASARVESDRPAAKANDRVKG